MGSRKQRKASVYNNGVFLVFGNVGFIAVEMKDKLQNQKKKKATA